MIGSPPPSADGGINRLIHAGKTGALKHEFLYTHPYAHQARLLFFSMLDQEWPDLKRDLVRTCWRLFREACAPLAAAPASCVWTFHGGEQFNMPAQLHNFRHLCVSEDFLDLRREFLAWSQAAGRGIWDEWFLESAFFTLRTVSPASKGDDYDGADQAWRYPFEGTFPHRWPGANPKETSLRSEVPKRISSDHVRWTIARLSDPGLSWAGLVNRFQLERYAKGDKGYGDGISEAKRRVRVFRKWIDLTLADASTAPSTDPA